MEMTRRTALSGLVLAGLAQMARAGENPAVVRVGALVIDQAWARATPRGAPVGGGYIRITNTGAQADRLLSLTSPAAAHVDLHQMSMEGAVMRMRPVTGGLVIAPGATVEMSPNGFHLMFDGLSGPFVEGTQIAATLKFEKAGEATINLDVLGLGARGPARPK